MAEITEKRFPRIVFTDSQDNSEISGGNSDFSIAKVTVSSDSTYTVCFSALLPDDSGIFSSDDFVEMEDELNVPLYNGFNMWIVKSVCEVACTGDITYNSENGRILIHGDGTITITGGTT